MNNPVTYLLNADKYILSALEEDVTSEDISTDAVTPGYVRGTAELICRQDCVVCGLHVFERVFTLLDRDTRVTFYAEDGDRCVKGRKVADIEGDIRVLLSGERTALNYLQRMSGIATLTAETVKQLEGTHAKLLDTRKTTPNMRVFEKYAVKTGGGCNHRFNLSDGVLLKDNHIGAAGGVREAVLAAKAYVPFGKKIEIEVENLGMCREAVEAGADIIMLDNMTPGDMKKAVEMIAGRAETECSGGVNASNIREMAGTGVDYISCGALTHSAPAADFSMKNLRPSEVRDEG